MFYVRRVDSMRYEKSCGAVVFKKVNGELNILLLKHNNGGHWGLPKGHVEEGETEQETAIREVYEETGIEVSTLYDQFRYKMEYSPMEGVVKEVIYFVAEASEYEIKIQVEEVEKCEWISYEEALEVVTYDNTKQLLLKAGEFIKNNIA